jgi:hypothetical protein
MGIIFRSIFAISSDEMVSGAKTIASAGLFQIPTSARANLFIRSASISHFQSSKATLPAKRHEAAEKHRCARRVPSKQASEILLPASNRGALKSCD